MKTVLITGIGRGIGLALAEKFLAEGWQVIGTYLNSGPDLVKANLKTVPLDLSSEDSIGEAIKIIAGFNLKIDLLINNAGVLLDEEETALKPDKLSQTLKVNVVGTANFTEQVLPLLAEGSQIIFISSEAGSLALSGRGISHYPDHYPAYKISKAALNMYMVTLARRLDQQIIVSALHPGWVKTTMGGEEADLTPAEAAENIYTFSLSSHPTGQLWFKGESIPW